jgi:signal transduction histidine kinase
LPTRNALYILFALLVALPVGAAIYLGTVGVKRERAMLIERERTSMNRRVRDVRDSIVRQLQADARASERPTVEAINRDYLDPGSPRRVVARHDDHIDRVQLRRDDPREVQTRPDANGLPRYLYLSPYAKAHDPGGTVALADGYILVFEVRPTSTLDRTLDSAGEQVNWILGIISVVVALGMLFAWRAVRAEARLAERKADFVSAVSHELRTPLTSIRMYADMLHEGWAGDEKTRTEYLALISSESERLARLVNNVLDFSRIEKGSKRFDIRLGDAGAVIEEAAEMLRPYLNDKGFELVIEVPDALPECLFDKDALTQMLVNLIDNAAKYGAVNSGEGEVRIEARAADGGVVLSVLDRGPGVPAGDRDRIFNAFHRGANAKSGGGSGLGLALVSAYAKAHGGSVELHDRDGGGAVFALRLPAA